MNTFIRACLLAAVLLAGGSVMQAQVAIGITIVAPPPARVMRVYPERPGPEFIWVEGYWYPVGHHYKWHEGYWTQPPYEGAHWAPPRYEGGQFFMGYWDGDHGRLEHDHRWDHDRDRDHDRDHERDWERDHEGDRH
jgi:hypothetical protein